MTTLYMVLGGVVVFALVVFALVGVSKKLGEESSRAETLESGESRREAFDRANQRGLAFGRELIARLGALRRPR